MNQEVDISLINCIRMEKDDTARAQAMEDLVYKYLPMIRHIVKNQNISPADFEDYCQEGALGLLKAIEQFKPEAYPVKFSTFAYLCILRRIYNRIKQTMTKKSMFAFGSISLYHPLNDDYSRTILDSVMGDFDEPFSQLEKEWMKEQIDSVLQVYLSPLEYQVVQLGLKGYGFCEIQELLSLSPKVIDNARTRARLKLKKVLLEYGSFLNPKIPKKTRKRKDLAIRLKVV